MLMVFAINALVVATCVLVHYECLELMSRWIPRLPLRHRLRIVIGVWGALCAHAIEVWLFALAYDWMLKRPGWGTLTGNLDHSLWDLAYFSFTVFSTLGFGDIQPEGKLRYLTGLESLTGLVLVTWTASFLFLEMEKEWRKRR
ncbi:potassium channel family protein [Pokkaliibacter sp. CJK22405]|uniref:potassium channel family protein n=1 Tax=Pokkaliibacter sp. CJK22405 TaxID=3384615 RepID=UPI003984B81A